AGGWERALPAGPGGPGCGRRRRWSCPRHPRPGRPPAASSPCAPPALDLAEVAERDAERRGGTARSRTAQARQLHLALAAEAAVSEIIVEVARVRHELRDPWRQRAQHGERARSRPVRAWPRLAEEVIRRAQPRTARTRARGTVLAPHRQSVSPRDVQDHVAHRRIETPLVMAVEIPGHAPHPL